MRELNADFAFRGSAATCASEYLWEPLVTAVQNELSSGGRIFDVGCGNGATAAMLGRRGYHVTGVDPSESGIRIARSAAPTANLALGSAYDDLRTVYGQFPVVISLEVVEHCFWPRKFASTIYDLVAPGGLAVISTPYHGYLKNLALALTNRFDAHWSPLWDGGHIKFWSEKTLTTLLREAQFDSVTFVRAGRIPALAKSMIALARKQR